MTKSALTSVLVGLAMVSSACDPKFVDEDGDGVEATFDCDDQDFYLGAIDDDADCDGIETAFDCNDDDGASGPKAGDADCDGVPTALDCDDASPELGAVERDADCDGADVDVDCDDQDDQVGSDLNDKDCDGTLTEDDCDDRDASMGPRSGDLNCDGTVVVQSIAPTDGQLGIDIDSRVVVVFDEPIDPQSLEGSVRWGPVGYVGTTRFEKWEDGMGGSMGLDADQRTLRIVPPGSRFQEFETTYWVEIDGVTNQNGDPIETFRSDFTTVRFDTDYEYRFRNVGYGGALDNLPGDPIEAVLHLPFGPDVYTGSLWHIQHTGDGTVALSNVWLGTNWLLDAAAGNRPAYMYNSSSANDYRKWTFTQVDDNVPEQVGESPRAYRMQSRATGELNLAGYGTRNGRILMGMVSSSNVGSHWVPYNVGAK